MPIWLDAHLFAPPPPRRPGQTGRPRRQGERVPKLAERRTRTDPPWQRVSVPDWYGEGERRLEIASGTAVWVHAGLPVLPIRWGLVCDPVGTFKLQALLCTDPGIDPVQILTWFVRRWRLEVTFEEVSFEEARAHLGRETQPQWSDAAIARTTPALLALVLMVTLWANHLFAQAAPSPRQTRWYTKPDLTFSDAIAAVRRHLWGPEDSVTSNPDHEVVEIPRALLNRLTDTLCYDA